MLSLRAHALITGGLFAAIVLLASIGTTLEGQGLVLPDGSGMQLAVRIVFFGLVLLFGLSAMPLMVKLVLGAQVRLGNANRPVIRTALAHERSIVFIIWALQLTGLAIAVPAAIRDGFLQDVAGEEIAATPSRGTLVARPGMTVAEVARRSSLKLNAGQTVIADGTIFTFQIADTGISFPRCRYYFITYAKGDTSRIGMMSVGTASRSLSRTELEMADAALRDRLAADGWLTGHEVYRTEQDRILHGGLGQGPEGRTWLKDDTVLTISRRRLDDSKPAEAADAGEWIQFVEMDQRSGWSLNDRFVFAAPRARP